MKRFKIELGATEKLTPKLKEKIEIFMPQWVKSLLPYYEEGLAQDVDIMALSNYMPVGDQGPLYEKDGIGYFLHEEGSARMLTFNCEYKYIKCNWEDCFKNFYPDYFKKGNERNQLEDFFYLHWHMWRLHNTKEGYNDVSRQVDEYFKELTGNPNAGLSLSSTSMIYYTPKGKWYIDNWCTLE